MAVTTDPEAEPARLRRVLGPLEVTASGVGIIIGAGIYVLLGAATAEAGNAVWLSFLIAAGLCGLTGLSYAELASMFPSAGAEYDYTRRVFPPRWAFLVGWTMTVGLMVAAAAIAVGFAHYLQYFVDVPLVAAAVTLLVFDAMVSLSGIGRSARLTLALSALQVAGLIFVIVIGASHVGDRSVLSDATTSGVLGGAALVFFAFIGFDEVITLAEETRNPTRVIPRALFAALGISALLYMAVAVTAVSVIGATALAESNRPLADVMAHVLGGSAEGVVAAIALLTTTNTSLLALTAASRLTYGMATADALPAAVRRVSRRTGAPTAGILVAAVGAVGFALIGDLTFVASVTDFAVYAVFLAVNAAVIVLRRTAPDVARPFRIPGSIRGVPVIPVAGSIAALAMVPQLEARSLWLGAALLATGLLAYEVLGRTSSSPRIAPRWRAPSCAPPTNAHITITVEPTEGDAMSNKVVHWEIGGSDLDALSGFYENLFEWKATGFDADYRLVDLGDGVGGGLMRCRDDMPSYVTIYVAVDDLEDTLAKVKDLGGTPLVPPTPIPGVGAFALFQDPAGNTIGILQPTSSSS